MASEPVLSAPWVFSFINGAGTVVPRLALQMGAPGCGGGAAVRVSRWWVTELPAGRPCRTQCPARDGARSICVDITNEGRQRVARICEAGLGVAGREVRGPGTSRGQLDIPGRSPGLRLSEMTKPWVTVCWILVAASRVKLGR